MESLLKNNIVYLISRYVDFELIINLKQLNKFLYKKIKINITKNCIDELKNNNINVI